MWAAIRLSALARRPNSPWLSPLLPRRQVACDSLGLEDPVSLRAGPGDEGPVQANRLCCENSVEWAPHASLGSRGDDHRRPGPSVAIIVMAQTWLVHAAP